MYEYTTKLLEIAIEDKYYNKYAKWLVEEYKSIIKRIEANNITEEDIEEINYLYSYGYKQNSFTDTDRQELAREMEQLKKVH